MTGKLKVLDLFSGIGGFSLGLERTGGFETVAFCEIEEFPRKVLAKHWPDVPCFKDVRELKGQHIDGAVDVICGGYPCQPFSTAGKRLGAEDDRHLWPEFARLVEELRPLWVIGENVAGHVSMGLDSVLSDLEALGYTARPFVIPACAVDAKHRRDRVWTIAYSNYFLHARGLGAGRHTSSPSGSEGRDACEGKTHDRERLWIEPGASGEVVTNPDRTRPSLRDVQRRVQRQTQCDEDRQAIELGGEAPEREVLANPERVGQQGQRQLVDAVNSTAQQIREAAKPINGRVRQKWLPEPNVGRVANGVPNRVDRLKSLGNAVVPQIPEAIGHAILSSMQEAP